MDPVLGLGSLIVVDPAVFDHNAPSFYADSVAWLVAEAVDRALGQAGDQVGEVSDEVGVVVISEVATTGTMHAIGLGAARGRVSPLRFAGANPGVLAGLTCIRRRFRGPSLVLSTSPAAALGAGVAVVRGWLDSAAARYVVLAAHFVTEAGEHVVNCAIVGEGKPVDLCSVLLASPPERLEERVVCPPSSR
ncbi:Beta-ketoacyl synthase, N-terminal domain [Lentzea xinjiangensis]|uniref:Beta-ketoacyl synthase, N-terminal domain n=1 Tax=Lentzea xinjiangensis TaxID=402600 RepID=A0A1H9SZD6_9PSEU|nr:beta-ketoacyl synthase N-terminal-like domain-containing protein [Lentzea xinjiangensis]SER90238.1 Beta-ketoacyl synthase, N-terminal domain [Lentzea xinjiangensis]